MGRISEAQVALVKERADIVQVIGERVALEKKGRDFVGRCPFHEEKTPSFHVTPSKQAWYCHGSCKKGGYVFDFVMATERVSFPEAVRLVARRVGIEIEEESPEERARAKHKGDRLAAIQRAVEFYARTLWKKNDATARKAREFLERRGVREETARAFSLGVAPLGSPLVAAARKEKGLLSVLEEVGLVRQGRDGPRDFFHGRVLFPIADESGRWIAFGARRLDEKDEPKFLNSPDVAGIFEKKRVLYGLDRARDSRPGGIGGQGSSIERRADRFVVVEGYMDVVIAHQAGIANVVAALSTGFTKEHASLVRRFKDGVVLLFDGDAAGQTANRRVLEALLELDLDARVATLPAGMDPDDFVLKEGPEAFDRLVTEGSRDVFDHLVDIALAKSGKRKPGESLPRAVIVECARLLGKYKDDINHQRSLKNVAHKLGFPEDLLRKEAVKAREAARRGARPERPERERALEEAVADCAFGQVLAILGEHACAGEAFEVGLLEALLARPDLAASVARSISAEDFTAGPLREAASAVLALAGERGGEGAQAAVLERLAERKAASGVVSRLLSRIDEHRAKDYEAEAEGGAALLVARRLRSRAAALQREVESAQSRQDEEALARLLAEKASVERAIGASTSGAVSRSRGKKQERGATLEPATSRPGGRAPGHA